MATWALSVAHRPGRRACVAVLLCVLAVVGARGVCAQPEATPSQSGPPVNVVPARSSGWLRGATSRVARRQPEAVPAGAAQPTATQPVTTEVIAALEARLADVDPAAQEPIRAALGLARAALDQQGEQMSAVARSQQEIDAAPAALEASRAALAAPVSDPAASLPASATLAELETLLSQARAQLDASRGQLVLTEAEPAARQKRRDAIPGELADAQRAMEAAESAAAAPQPPDTLGLLTEARLVADRAAGQAARARALALQRELASLDARRENLQSRLDLARRDVAEREALVRELDRRVGEARRVAAQEAEEAARRALLAAADAHPRVQEALQFTQRLAARLATDPHTRQPGAEEQARTANEQALAATASLEALRADYRSTFERVETIGLTDTMGRLLREKRRRLDSPLDLRERIRADREARASILLELFELRPLEAEWGQPGQVARRVAEGEASLPAEARSVLQAQLQDALLRRLEAYRKLVAELEAYQSSLGVLDAANRDRLALLVRYIREIDRTILWVPSHHAASPSDLSELASGIRWIGDPEAWGRAVRGAGGIADDVADRPIITLGPLLAVLLLALVARPALARTTDQIHERARRVGTDSFRLTIRALILGAIIAAVPPAFLLALYAILSGAGDAADQPRAVGVGCLTAAGVLFVMTLVTRVVRRNGLAEIHFRWPESVTAAIRSKLRWLTPLALATHPLVAAVTLDPETPGGPALARWALVVWLAALAMALYRLLRPHGPALAHFLRISPGGWIDRLRWIWYPTAFASPLALAVIALLGYIETARELERRYLETIGLILALILVSAVVTRWIALARRRVAMEGARRRREALDAEHAKELGADPTASAPVEPDHGANLEEIDAQTRQLLRFGVGLSAIFGIWGLWVGVLPALGMLERVELWPELRITPQTARERARDGLSDRAAGQASSTPATVAPASPQPAPAGVVSALGASAGSSGTSGDGSGDPGTDQGAASADAPPGIFTLADLLTVIVLALATLVASRNVPGVAEILLLQHLPLDRGARYAVTTVFRYAILIVGVSATLNAVGIGWGKVQWLAAALTFGLGFGLQEIFANFVSGLIILAERPIRIGDTVTVNNLTGNVSKIRMRATTIVDYDKRELVVPNRSFITDSVVNWTLSDPTTRVVIPVGVAYGSDVNVVRDTLLRVGKASSYILEGREPMALFRAFGASSLEFELRVWTRNVEESHLARDEMLRALDRALREAKVEIALPQQDVRIRSLPPGAGLPATQGVASPTPSPTPTGGSPTAAPSPHPAGGAGAA